jgi:hypothetical protein
MVGVLMISADIRIQRCNLEKEYHYWSQRYLDHYGYPWFVSELYVQLASSEELSAGLKTLRMICNVPAMKGQLQSNAD